MSEDNKENLPASFEAPVISEFPALKPDCSPEEAARADVQIANTQLDLLHYGLTQVKSVSGLCKIVAEITSLVRHRRAIMQLPYGTRDSASKPFTVTPLD